MSSNTQPPKNPDLDFSLQYGYYQIRSIDYLCPGGRMTDINYVNEGDFKAEVLDSTLPVLVDFTATWCGPCKMLDPIVKQLAVEWEGKVKVVKLDVDQNTGVAMQYQVMGVPTLMLFSNGEPQQRLTGYQPKDRIVSKLGSHI
jgi:thioredoxin 1